MNMSKALAIALWAMMALICGLCIMVAQPQMIPIVILVLGGYGLLAWILGGEYSG